MIDGPDVTVTTVTPTATHTGNRVLVVTTTIPVAMVLADGFPFPHFSPDEPESYDPERPQLGDQVRRDRSPGRNEDSYRGGRRERGRGGRGRGRDGRAGREGRENRERVDYFSPEDWALIGETEQPRFTLALVNIPPVYNHPEQVTQFLGQFGPVERIELNQPKRKAYVMMTDPKDAHAAIVNPYHPFNNPLTRIMWADKHQAHLIYTAKKISEDPSQALLTDDPAALIEKKKAEKLEKERLALEKEAQQREMLEKQAELHKKKIEQQKELLKLLSDKLTTLKDPSRRSELLVEMKRITEKLEAQLKAPPPASLADLEAQLAQKRAEAVALGVLPPARGRGIRGRGRGRGAPATAYTPGRFTLDNRPSAFTVDNSSGALNSSQLEAAFQSFGGSVQAQDNGFLVSFPNRRAAEAAFAKGPGLLDSASLAWSSGLVARETVEIELSGNEDDAAAPDEKSWKR